MSTDPPSTCRPPATLFAGDYATARQRFREAAAALGCAIEAYPIDRRGPGGEALAIDVAITPGATTQPTLIVSSGIHGVEGFLGSAVQLAVLREWAERSRPGPAVRCVFLHALNPFGFAWHRRVNESNVDLNRNLLLAGESFNGSPPRYRQLDGLLNPKRAPSRWEPVTLRFLHAIARYGMPALKHSVASGQYDFPRGLFYGGDGPSRTNDILSANFERWLGDSRRVTHIDLHTGLGSRAACTLLLDAAVSEAQRRRLVWFGPDSYEVAQADGVAYQAIGSLGKWCVARGQGRDYLFVTAEFGTCSAIRVLAGLRAENQAYHWGRRDRAATEGAKRDLVELFCPRSATWRGEVLARGVGLVRQAVDGLAAEAE